ncbi:MULTISPECIES: glycine cleavage T C-terminal barrel domain-containing protein [unclassified Novosphingobium]|uniref:glycine cleavage T C-terminal barrel domain-containing protein n=1 Tax=unclassified Novosphingobium TaxID=2644732 RepID=UPI000A46A4CB|nr:MULTISPECIES: glycine cleavage T C-terminal barrel domain-containing protein [unclassified Novosphingobium]MBN9142335.1 aminomethyltransferase family protein [Novosphingobium sp.]
MSRDIITYLRAQTPAYHPGWGGPEYTGWQDEQTSWKTDCYLGDWSFLWDIEVEGPDALKVFSDTGVNSVGKFAVGQAKHLVQCNGDGKVVADGVLMRMGEQTFRTQSATAFVTAFALAQGSYNARWRVIETFQLQVSGPKALAVCQAVTGETLDDIKFMHFREVRIAGRTVFALRQGMAGEIGFEFHGDAVDVAIVKEAILVAGAVHGIRQLGRRTAMINHLEAAFPTGAWHYLGAFFSPETAGLPAFMEENFDTKGVAPVLRGSFDPSTIDDYLLSPYELGWGKSVKFDHNFVGREALEAESVSGAGKRRVTLVFDPADVVRIYASLFDDGKVPYDFLDIPHPQRWVVWADEVRVGDNVIGFSSTPGYSYWFRKVLALAFIDAAYAEPGTRVEILWGAPGSRQTTINATVAQAPYKVDNRRLDLTSTVA